MWPGCEFTSAILVLFAGLEGRMTNGNSHFDSVCIKSTGSYVPRKILTNQEVVANLPTSPQWVVDTLGISNRCAAFDVAAVCAGFIYGITIAGQFIQNGSYERVLVIGADTFSKVTDWNHRCLL